MVLVSEILSRMNDGVFLENVFSRDADWDAALDARDAPDFDTAWCMSDEKVSASCPPESNTVNAIRESAFKRVYAITQSADLAGYVSDDMGLIALAFDNQLEIEFVDGLWETYSQGKFPGGVVQD
ncbi:hypothetical protein FXN63_01840 [Pigmentiphaga aceris]|uniref:Uncharacterized protein n=2 Tax=Pigmentiphaga aceris TaxID=1940612 RepID=A0A5C0B487_9BURK|nr:hypothetical protein FXN63_01840 [Pigmentiphaga aceris]